MNEGTELLGIKDEYLSERIVLESDPVELLKKQEEMRWLIEHPILKEYVGDTEFIKYFEAINFCTENKELLEQSGNFENLVNTIMDLEYSDIYRHFKCIGQGIRDNNKVEVMGEFVPEIRYYVEGIDEKKIRICVKIGGIAIITEDEYSDVSRKIYDTLRSKVLDAEKTGKARFNLKKVVQFEGCFEGDEFGYKIRQANRGFQFLTGGYEYTLADRISKNHFDFNFGKKELLEHSLKEMAQKYDELSEDVMVLYEYVETLKAKEELMDANGTFPNVAVSAKSYDDNNQVNWIVDDPELLKKKAHMQIMFQNGLAIPAPYDGPMKIYRNLIYHRGVFDNIEKEQKLIDKHQKESDANSIIFLDEPFRCVVDRNIREREDLAYECVKGIVKNGWTVYINTSENLCRRLENERWL